MDNSRSESYSSYDSEYDSAGEESDDEGVESYKIGGYHPVKVGQVYNDRFVVLEKLGWGHFSTVWRCNDRDTGRHVAMKVQKSAKHYTSAARDEIELLEKVKESAAKNNVSDPRVVLLIDSFEHTGPHGTHMCMVFEMLGENLLTLIKRFDYKGIPMEMTKKITKQMLEGLDFLHKRCHIIHTDLKPENVLLQVPLPKQSLNVAAIQAQLADVKVTGDQRKKLKRQLKKLQDDQLVEKMDSLNITDNFSSTQLSIQDTAVCTNEVESARVTLSEAKAKGATTFESMENMISVEMFVPAVEMQNILEEETNPNEWLFSIAPTTPEDGSGWPVRIRKVESRDEKMREYLKSCSNDIDMDAFEGCGLFQITSTQEKAEWMYKLLEDAMPGLVFVTVPENTIVGLYIKTLIPSLWTRVLPFEQRIVSSKTNVTTIDPRVKIADLGNACWTFNQFSPDIQTRQYRSPEVILGQKYDTSADMWSLACFVFELLTGDMLFSPKSGKDYDRDEDHLAQCIELLGPMSRQFATHGVHARKFFTRGGRLKHIGNLKYWGLSDVLAEKYHFSKAEAKDIESFLKPLLEYVPAKRCTAAEALKHSWLV